MNFESYETFDATLLFDVKFFTTKCYYSWLETMLRHRTDPTNVIKIVAYTILLVCGRKPNTPVANLIKLLRA